MNYSLTILGVIVSVAGTILVKVGFSEQCSTEITQFIPVVIGGLMSWVGRVKAGGVKMSGFKETCGTNEKGDL